MPEAVDKYPEVKTFGPVIPAYGVWARHVKGLKLINVQFKLAANDLRPAIICEDGKDITITGGQIPETSGAQAIIRLENVIGAHINNMNVKGTADAFVWVEGTDSKNIQVTKNEIPDINKKIELAPDITTAASNARN